jgi:hypothetical protein
MNLLVDELPQAVLVDGIEYLINFDFRTCLRIILAFEDPDLAEEEKFAVMLQVLYPQVPENIYEAGQQAAKFMNCGQEPNEESSGHRLYSFTKDASYIFSAFRQTHNIDLETAKLHWWKFMSLFMDLGQDTTFCSLVALRKRMRDGEATPQDRRMARDLGPVFEVELEESLTDEEQLRLTEFERSMSHASI